MTHEPSIIEETKTFVKSTLKDAEGGHDWFHIQRVYNLTKTINQTESGDSLVVALGALLHDIADSKFHNGDETVGPQIAREFLFSKNVDSVVIEHVVKIIENISFKGGHKHSNFSSKEFHIVQDADRLDALGAIGIARTFNYGGFKNRPLYNPEIPPNPNMTKAEYKKAAAPTINHFYEKLLLLKDLMTTETGKLMAKERHDFMEQYLKQFFAEWDATC